MESALEQSGFCSEVSIRLPNLSEMSAGINQLCRISKWGVETPTLDQSHYNAVNRSDPQSPDICHWENESPII